MSFFWTEQEESFHFEHVLSRTRSLEGIIISKPRSRITVMVAPTNEELPTVRDSYELVRNEPAAEGVG